MDFHFTPKQFINYLCQTEGVTRADFGVAETVILTWFGHVFDRLVIAANAQTPAYSWMGRRLKVGQIEGHSVTIVRSPIGAPGTISLMEELIECGAKRIIGIGYAGSLQASAPIGSIIIPTHCVSDEGTSRHYLESAEDAYADECLMLALQQAAASQDLAVHIGKHWTTDGIYRESVTRIKALQAQGVLGVDMETSAMYVLGHVRNVSVCNALVVSDELYHDWNPGFQSEALRIAKNRLEDAIIDVIPYL